MSLKRINHGNENHTPGFVEDTGDTMTGDLVFNKASATIRGDVDFLVLGTFPNGRLILPYGIGVTDACVIGASNIFFPVQAPTVSAPSYVEGGVYYDTTLHKLRIGGVAGWETVTSS